MGPQEGFTHPSQPQGSDQFKWNSKEKWDESVHKELGGLTDTATLEEIDEASLSQLKRQAASQEFPVVITPGQIVFVVKSDGSFKSRFVCCGKFTAQIYASSRAELRERSCKPGTCYRVHEALYGLRESPHLWGCHRDGVMIGCSRHNRHTKFTPSPIQCLFRSVGCYQVRTGSEHSTVV
eukprot:5554119-Amphidinium_carterae.1